MAERQVQSFGQIRLENKTDTTAAYGAIIHGDADTRAEVRAEVDNVYPNAPKGTLYTSTGGEMFLKVNTAGADTDWEVVTTEAGDSPS